MIKFVDLNNGYVFDTAAPYIFWFDDQQSTNIIYTKNICLVSDAPELNFKIEDSNSIFSFLDVYNTLENNFNYDQYLNFNDIKSKNIDVPAELININGKDFYLYNLYISASTDKPGEYIENIEIKSANENLIFKVGVDFYEENESLYINLSNFGIEIPESFQKVIKDSNVHEDYKDNILINRKFKELISNYWDIIANKGSYKSLTNSLNWFEYGDLVELKEIWKLVDSNTFLDKELSSILEDKYKELLNNYSKTSFFSLHAALQNITNGLDEEKNPVLVNKDLNSIAFKWGVEDLSLKMSLLGQFYETLFMPIHTSLIRSTIEDIVFTNNIKLVNSHSLSRNDFNYNFNYIDCNIKDGQIFRLGDVDARVTNDTVFANKITGNESVPTIGVDTIKEGTVDEGSIKTFSDQYYTGVGVIVPITLNITKMDKDDNVKQTQISLIDDKTNKWVTVTFYNIYHNTVSFNLLCTKEKDYDIRIQITTMDSKTFTKQIKFSVVDMSNCTIDIKKIVADIPDENKLYEVKDYLFMIQDRQDHININDDLSQYYFTQYIPSPDVKLNNILIFEGDYNITDDYFKLNRYQLKEENGRIVPDKEQIKYTIYISKEFTNKIYDISKLQDKSKLVRNDLGFIPQFHKYIDFYNDDKFNINNYIIRNSDLLCMKPNIKFGKYIEEYEWVFENVSTLKNTKIELPISSRGPLVANTKQEPLPAGYYNIIFKYKLIDGQVDTLKLNSAFIKK